MINEEVRESIKRSVLCWLATVSSDNEPNVSPKELFMEYGNDSIIIANIASPQSEKNIIENDKVCVSFIDIFVQKGFQIKGSASIYRSSHEAYNDMKIGLESMTQGKFPIQSIIHIKVERIKPILAPSYIFYPETTEEKQIESAKKTYLEKLK